MTALLTQLDPAAARMAFKTHLHAFHSSSCIHFSPQGVFAIDHQYALSFGSINHHEKHYEASLFIKHADYMKTFQGFSNQTGFY